MTIIHNVNTSPATGAIAMYNFKEVLKAAGWTIPESSDGTTHTMNDSITSGGNIAGGLDNTHAYFRAQDPGTRREIVCQHNLFASGNGSWRIKYSALAKFVSVVGTNVQTPAATDEVYLLGGGTDAVPTFDTLFNGGDGTYKHHTIAQNAAEGNVYGFWSFSIGHAATTSNEIFCCEPIDVNNVSALDEDRCVFLTGPANPVTTSLSSTTTTAKCWYKFNIGGAAFGAVAVPGMQDPSSGATEIPGGAGGWGVNPTDASDNTLPVIWGRPSSMGAPTGLKGISKYLKYRVVTGRAFPDSLNLATVGGAYAFLADFLFPWPDGVVPIT